MKNNIKKLLLSVFIFSFLFITSCSQTPKSIYTSALKKQKELSYISSQITLNYSFDCNDSKYNLSTVSEVMSQCDNKNNIIKEYAKTNLPFFDSGATAEYYRNQQNSYSFINGTKIDSDANLSDTSGFNLDAICSFCNCITKKPSANSFKNAKYNTINNMNYIYITCNPEILPDDSKIICANIFKQLESDDTDIDYNKCLNMTISNIDAIYEINQSGNFENINYNYTVNVDVLPLYQNSINNNSFQFPISINTQVLIHFNTDKSSVTPQDFTWDKIEKELNIK